jgi:HK97 family phage portal protein
MSLFGTIARGVAPTRTRSGVPSYAGLIPPLGATPSSAGVLVSQATAMAVSTVYACVQFLSVDTSRCRPSLVRLMDDGSEETVTDHPVAALLNRPNRQQSWREFCQQLQMSLKLRGNGYAAIRRDHKGNPIELIPINPDAVLVLEASDGEIFYNVNRLGLWQIAMLRDFPVQIPQEDMFHVRGLTFNALVGASVITLARDSIGLSIAQEQQAARWIANGARPSGIIEYPRVMSDAVASRLKQSWNDFQSGIQNVGKTAVLEDGAKYTQMALTSVDLEFLASRQFQITDIARWFNVPAFKLGITDKTAMKDMPSAEQEYVNTAIAPDLDLWEQRLGFTFDLHAEGLRVDFDSAPLLRADILTRYNAARLGILSGFLTPNEVRANERLPMVPGRANDLMVPANTAALGSDVTGTAPDGAGRPSGGNPAAPGVPTNGDQVGTMPGESPVGEL